MGVLYVCVFNIQRRRDKLMTILSKIVFAG